MEPKRAAVFLDRDGVLNESPGEAWYVRTWDEFRFLDRAREAVRLFWERGLLVFVVSNQSGIARGLMRAEDLETLTRNMAAELERAGGMLAGVYYCVHDDPDGCDCRKPRPGLYLKAARERNVDLTRSFNVGDSERDIEAGNALGLRSVLVLSGKTRGGAEKLFRAKPETVKKDLYEAAQWITSR